MFPGKFKLLFVDIEAAYANFSVRVYSGRGFFLNLVENRPVRTFPVKIIEIPVHSARDVRRNERRLDGYRTRAAKNIGERSRRLPHGKLNKRGSERFFQRRFTHKPAIAASVKSLAGSIERNGDEILPYSRFDLVSCTAFR